MSDVSAVPAVRTPAAVAADVTALFDWLFGVAEAMRAELAPIFAAGPVTAESVVAAVAPHAAGLLERDLVLGGGFVAARDALADQPLYLAWWQGESRQLLGFAGAPGGDPLDYTTREWFRVPAETGALHVAGPYVDYVCTDEYVVTSTLPVVVDGRMVGVTGADMLVESLERHLLPALREADASLLGHSGRVVVSADHRLAPGERLDTGGLVGVPCGPYPLAVVSRPAA